MGIRDWIASAIIVNIPRLSSQLYHQFYRSVVAGEHCTGTKGDSDRLSHTACTASKTIGQLSAPSPPTLSPARASPGDTLLTTATRSILRCPYVCPGVTQSDTPSFSTKTSKCRTKSRTKLNFINLIGTPTDYNYVNNNSLLCIITNENNIDDHVSVCYAWHISYTCTSYDLGKERVYVSAVGTCTFFFFSFDCLLLV